jgi:DNA-binding PadR family transcriptional regulator
VAAPLTPAELTVLGLLVEQPRHGYELEEVITLRGMREWTEIGFSSIYYLLGRLRDRGLITDVDSPPGGRDKTGRGRTGRGKARRVFAATDAGRAECAAGAEALIAEVRPLFPPLLVGLANQPVIPADRLRAALDARATALDEQLTRVRAAARSQLGAPPFVRAIFDHSLRLLDAERAWLDTYRESL